jgi:hypothetical protein
VNLPGGITIDLGSQPEVISLIVDRLIMQSQTVANERVHRQPEIANEPLHRRQRDQRLGANGEARKS